MLRPSSILCALITCAAVRLVVVHAHEYIPFKRNRRNVNARQQRPSENEITVEGLDQSEDDMPIATGRFLQSQPGVGLAGVLFDPAETVPVETEQTGIVEQPAMHFQVLGLLDKVAPVVAEAQIEFHAQFHEDCAVCLEPVDFSSEIIRRTQCGHIFHSGCLEEWIRSTSSSCLDWRNYVMSTAEDVKVNVRRPVCPYCVSDLPVLPSHLVQQAVFTSFSMNLSISSMSHGSYFRGATRMWQVLSAMDSSISREYEPHTT